MSNWTLEKVIEEFPEGTKWQEYVPPGTFKGMIIDFGKRGEDEVIWENKEIWIDRKVPQLTGVVVTSILSYMSHPSDLNFYYKELLTLLNDNRARKL